MITEEQNNSKEFGPTIKGWIKESGGEAKLALNCVGGKKFYWYCQKIEQ